MHYTETLFILFLTLPPFFAIAISDEDVDNIKSGLGFAESVVTTIEKIGAFPEFIISAASGAIGFISATLSFVGFILSFFGNRESPELLAIKRLYTQVNHRFDVVDVELSAIQKQIDWSRLKLQFGELQRNIKSDYTFLKNIYESPLADKTSERDFFVHAWESNCWVCALNLYHGIMGADAGFSDDILQVATDTFKNNRPLTQTFMTGLLKLLVTGINNELAFRSFKYPDNDNLYEKSLWKARLENVTTRMFNFDQKIKNAYHSQAEKDIINFAKIHITSELNNQNFSKELYDFLVQKYYWRDWLVIVYKPIWGDKNHNNNMCDGYREYRTYGRNIAVSSVDQSDTSIDIPKANAIIDGIYTLHYDSMYIYTNLLPPITHNCSVYASMGVIDSWVDLWYQGLPQRLVHKRTHGKNSYSIHLFG